MQNKYRKMYNENLLGTSDVSILKFYYASFKLQYSKGKITDLSAFLDDCAKISEETNLLLKISSLIPCFNLLFGTGREQKYIAEIIRTKREEVEKLFLKDDISNDDIKVILYGKYPTTQINQSIQVSQSVQILQINQFSQSGQSLHSDQPNRSITQDEIMQLVKEKILKCYSIDKEKQLGDRIFGYLLKSETLPSCSPKDRLNVWHTFLGEKIKPSNPKLFASPEENGSQNKGCTRKLLKDLYRIRDFFDGIGLNEIVRIVDRDIKNTPKKP